QPGSTDKKSPPDGLERGRGKRNRAYRFARNIAPLTSGLATLRADVSWAQQAPFSLQAVLALALTLALSAQQEAEALSAQVVFDLSLVFASPARATGNKA